MEEEMRDDCQQMFKNHEKRQDQLDRFIKNHLWHINMKANLTLGLTAILVPCIVALVAIVMTVAIALLP